MAICGHCLVCADKFVCTAKKSCGDCTEDKPLLVVADLDSRVVNGKICGECIDLIRHGALCSLIDALREAARATRPEPAS